MAKKKSKSAASATGDSVSADAVKEQSQHMQKNGRDVGSNHNGSDSDDSSSSDDDSLVLEGTLIRNPDVSDSDDDELSSEEEEFQEPMKKRAKTTNPKADSISSKVKSNNNSNTTKNQKSQSEQKKKSNEPETIQVEFLFCDMHERFFHGMKTLLHRNGVHAPHSSQLADLVIANVMVGTVLSTDVDSNGNVAAATHAEKKKSSSKASNSRSTAAASLPSPQEEANVFGFASIVNLSTNHTSPCIQSLKSICLKHCPTQHRVEMETVLSGKTKRPAGFFFQERMINVPLEITEVLHQQLVLDMDHAVDHAGDDVERKSLDFGAFVRLAPCYHGGGGGNSVIYKYFDDEVFATNAEFVYAFEIPKMHENDEEEMWCSVVVLTKTGHRSAMKELKKMIHVN